MTRWVIVADLNRCVGCQTCTAACKHANATAPGIQWRKVLDVEAGEYPDVRRAFLPVGCMQCEDAPCLDVCPTTATRKRNDGIVTIDYDLCIGCAYCIVACPYQARSRTSLPSRAFGGRPMRHEILRENPARLGVAQKCTFCVERIDAGLAKGLQPGIDLEATPACVGSCIAGALHFGNIDDSESSVSRLLAENAHFVMHEELGTGPGIHYLWDQANAASQAVSGSVPMVAHPVGMAGVSPALQTSWDWRAAANFILGGTGSGLAIAAAAIGGNPTALRLALLLIALGLGAVWLELGRPWRFMNVFLHPQRSWMTREAIAALPLFACGLGAVLTDNAALVYATAALALVFLYCQSRILRASKGIPAWRQEQVVPLVVVTGLTEGTAVAVLLAGFTGTAGALLQLLIMALLALLTVRHLSWRTYRGALGRIGAPTRTFAALDDAPLRLTPLHQLSAAVLLAVALALPGLAVPLAATGAAIAAVTGWVFKYTLITRAAFNQGYALNRFPARGAGTSAPGIKPGWSRNEHAAAWEAKTVPGSCSDNAALITPVRRA